METPNPHSREAISRRLKLLRIVHGKTQQQMADLIGIPQPSWGYYEKHKRQITTDHALRLCNVFGVNLDWIYRGNISQLPPELVDRLMRGEPPGAAPPDPKSWPEISKRLIALRRAMDWAPSNIARVIRVEPQTWVEYEAGLRPIGIQDAMALCEECDVTLDWIYRGITTGLTTGRSIELREKLEDQQTETGTNDRQD
jgi:transcriptional regulator with XRE-family HTH domain